MERSPTITTLAAALHLVQAALEPVKREAENPHLGKRYADLNSILDECRPVLAAQGISILHLPGKTKPLGVSVRRISKDGEIDEYPLGEVELTIMLLHRDGEFIAETMSLPCLMEYPSPAQGAVGAISYGRRHSILAALLMETEDNESSASSDIPLTDTDKCPVHKVPWRHVSGVYKQDHAKAGQSYDFWSCPGKVDGKYCQQRPPQGYKGPGSADSADDGWPSDQADAPPSEPTPEEAQARVLAIWERSKAAIKAKKLESMPPAPPAKDAPIAELLDWCEKCEALLKPAEGGTG